MIDPWAKILTRKEGGGQSPPRGGRDFNAGGTNSWRVFEKNLSQRDLRGGGANFNAWRGTKSQRETRILCVLGHLMPIYAYICLYMHKTGHKRASQARFFAVEIPPRWGGQKNLENAPPRGGMSPRVEIPSPRGDWPPPLSPTSLHPHM